jgi:hypothetical protein
VNRPEVAELAAVLSARFGGNEVEVAGAACIGSESTRMSSRRPCCGICCLATSAPKAFTTLLIAAGKLKLSRTLPLRVGGRTLSPSS